MKKNLLLSYLVFLIRFSVFAQVPTLTAPANGSVSAVKPTLDWDFTGGASFYLYQIDIVPTFNSVQIKNGQTSTSVSYASVSNLRYGQTYYWRVAAANSKDTSKWSVTWSFTTANTVTINLPVNKALNQPIRPTLDWTTLTGTTDYLYEIDTTAKFNSVFFQKGLTSGTVTYQDIQKLHYGTKYYWRIASRNSVDTSDWSQVWQFTTINSVTLNLPKEKATNEAVRPTLDWAPLIGSSNYLYEVDTSLQFNSSLLKKGSTLSTATYIDVYNLRYGTTYYWRIASMNAVDTSNWSAIWQFTTGNFVALDIPSDNSTQPVKVTLDWIPFIESTYYLYEVDTSANFNSSYLQKGSTSGTVSYQDIQKLHYGTKYYWRVASMNSADTSNWSTTRRFITTNNVTLVSPTNLQSNVSTSAHLDWLQIVGSIKYIIHADTSASFKSPAFIEKITSSASTNDVLNGLFFDTHYYWKIAAVNAVDTSAWSSIWSFYTGDVSTSIKEDQTSVFIFQNPCNDLFNLVFAENSTVELYDILGNKVLTANCIAGANHLDISHLEKGTYIIQVRPPLGKTSISKLIKN